VARIDTELVDQTVAIRVVRAERVDLTATAIQRENLLCA